MPTDDEPRCPRCGYALRGTTGSTCPECGADVGAAALARAAARRSFRRRWTWSAAILLPCIYAPYSWVFLMSYPWDAYRWLWAKMFPILPGLLPVALIASMFSAPHPPGWLRMLLPALATALLVALSLWLGSRGRAALIATAVVVLALSIGCSVAAHGLFLL